MYLYVTYFKKMRSKYIIDDLSKIIVEFRNPSISINWSVFYSFPSAAQNP